MAVKVTVGDKTEKNPLFGKGSSKCYYFNGKEAPELQIERSSKADTYVFQVDCPGYPLAFTLNQMGGPDSQFLNRTESGLPEPIESGELKIIVDENFPSKIYYNCTTQTGMGGLIGVHDEITFVQVKTGKVIRNPVRVKALSNDLIIGNKNGILCKFNDIDKLTKIFGLEDLFGCQILLHDFDILGENRLFLLVSKEKKIELIEVDDFWNEPKAYKLKEIEAKTTKLILQEDTLYLNVDTKIEILDVQKVGEFTPLSEISLKSTPRCLTIGKKLYALNSEILGTPTVLNYEAHTAIVVGSELYYGNNEGRISVLSIVGDAFKENWQTMNPDLRGLFDLIKTKDGRIYVALVVDEKLALWELI